MRAPRTRLWLERQRRTFLPGAPAVPLRHLATDLAAPSPHTLRRGPQADIQAGPCLPSGVNLGTGDDDLSDFLLNKPPYGTCLQNPGTTGPCTNNIYLSNADSVGFTRNSESNNRQSIAIQYLSVRTDSPTFP